MSASSPTSRGECHVVVAHDQPAKAALFAEHHDLLWDNIGELTKGEWRMSTCYDPIEYAAEPASPEEGCPAQGQPRLVYNVCLYEKCHQSAGVCAVAWTLQGVIGSQLGDVTSTIVVEGQTMTVRDYIQVCCPALQPTARDDYSLCGRGFLFLQTRRRTERNSIVVRDYCARNLVV